MAQHPPPLPRIAGIDDDVYRHQLQATIASLSYWVPSIADVARVEQEDASHSWRLALRPLVANACPFAITLRNDGRHDLAIGDEIYADRPTPSFALFLPLADAITAGRVVQRRWISLATGAVRSVETVVTLADGDTWRGGRTVAATAAAVAEDGTELRERSFVAYRR